MRPTVKLALNCPSCGNRYKMADDVYGHTCPAQKAPGRWARITISLGFFAGMQACVAHSPAPEVEAVGQIAAGPSVYSQPVHAATPPPSFELTGSADDDAGNVVITTTRVEDAGVDGETPQVEAKVAHGF